jgi:putative oxidoreductase
MLTQIQPESIAVLYMRLLLGMLFIFQGYDKIFRIKIKGVIQTIEPYYRQIKIPRFLIVAIAYLTSYIEFIGGILLFLGLFKYISLYVLGLDLLIVSLGMSLMDPVWKMDIVMPRFILLIILLLIPSTYDIYSIQCFLPG